MVKRTLGTSIFVSCSNCCYFFPLRTFPFFVLRFARPACQLHNAPAVSVFTTPPFRTVHHPNLCYSPMFCQPGGGLCSGWRSGWEKKKERKEKKVAYLFFFFLLSFFRVASTPLKALQRKRKARQACLWISKKLCGLLTGTLSPEARHRWLANKISRCCS